MAQMKLLRRVRGISTVGRREGAQVAPFAFFIMPLEAFAALAVFAAAGGGIASAGFVWRTSVNRSRWLLYGGLLGVIVWLSPNVRTAPLPRGDELTVRIGTFSWLEYQRRTENWLEGGKEHLRTETNTHVSFVNVSVFAGAIGLGLLGAHFWRTRPPRPAPPSQ